MIRDRVSIGNLNIDEKGPFFLIAGPCVIEDAETTLRVADFLKETGELLDIPVIFKTSYDKANRTSLDSYRGPGIDKGLEIIQEVKETTGLIVISDIHEASEIGKATKVLDILQIPAFLSRQTNLLISAGQTGLPINIKKGQFLSPWGIEPAIRKVLSTGNRKILITERGTSFGYNNLIVDIRSIAIMKDYGYPIVFDATHSVQLPGSVGTSSGGQREFVEPLSRAAIAAGAHGIFMEVHPEPDSALCDGPNSLPFKHVRPLLAMLKEIHGLVHSNR
jgi:2-dehydro-3-deoxyphosphooctonate aldolase (KDO 8-P synthase)